MNLSYSLYYLGLTALKIILNTSGVLSSVTAHGLDR